MHNTSILQQLEDKAVDVALRSDWAQAVKLNEEILKTEPRNVPALLRAGFASFQLKKYTQSLHYYKEVLKMQPQNMIALEYVEKIGVQKEDKKTTSNQKINFSPDLFVEHPGKTKSAVVNQLGQKSALARLVIGEEVALVVRKRHVEVRNSDEEYIGILPDDIGMRLMYFFEHESTYNAYIQEATLNRVVVFIREVKKGKKVERMASFPVDIPGSIAKVIAQQQAEDDITPIKKPESDEVDEFAAIEEKEDQHNLHDDLLNDLGGEDKQESEEILGIETDEDEDEEE